MNENTIAEEELEELENIHSYFDHNLPSPKINSVTMTVHHNDPDNFIGDPEFFASIASDF